MAAQGTHPELSCGFLPVKLYGKNYLFVVKGRWGWFHGSFKIFPGSWELLELLLVCLSTVHLTIDKGDANR